MPRWLLILALSLVFVGRLAADPGDEEQTQWIAVVAPGLRAAVEPLALHRKAEGFHVVVIDACATGAEALQRTVRATWQAWSGPSCVLLVGTPVGTYSDCAECVLPALAGTQGRMKLRATDNSYGCDEGQVVPRVAVGRLPARTPAEAGAMVAKTLAWENEERPGPWKRQFVLLAGAPSYNPIVDRLVENLAMSKFADLDPVWSGNAIYNNSGSCYALPTTRLQKQAVAYLGEGQLLTVYLGHSSTRGFWYDGMGGPYFSAAQWSELKLDKPVGILATFGCYGIQYDGLRGEGYGLYAMRNPHGPVAVIGSEWECWAAMAMLMSDGLLNNLPGATQAVRLGTLWLTMKRQLADRPLNPLVFQALNAVDGDPETPEAEQRLEHQEMFMLLGDPALRLPAFGHELKLQCPDRVQSGDTFAVRATLPQTLAGARGRVTLERSLTSSPTGIEPIGENLTDEQRERIMLANHRRSNDFVLCEKTVTADGTDVGAELRVPKPCAWSTLIVRVCVSDSSDDAVGVRVVKVASGGGE